MYQEYGKSRIRLPYDVDSPFGSRRPSKTKEILFKLFQNRILPRGFIYKAFLKSATRQQKDGIFDVNVADINVRLCPEVSVSDTSFLRRGKYTDFQEWQALAQSCRSVDPSPVFIDIGANIGMYSLLLAKEVPGLCVFAIEPHPGICSQLKYNCSLNPALNIHVRDYAVSDTQGKVTMKTGTEISISRIDEEGDMEVESITLADVVERENLTKINALKIDVEGYEDRVLVPYLRQAPDSMLPDAIVVEVITSEHWLEDPIKVAISRGYVEVKRNVMNSILIRQKSSVAS